MNFIKRFSICAFLIASMSVMLITTGCSIDKPGVSQIEKNADKLVDIPDYSKYITLGAYTGNTYEVPSEYIYSDENIEEDVQMEIKTTFSELTAEQDVTDRPAQLMDNINITYEGLIDGQPFEGGTSSENGEDIVLGYAEYPTGFEEGIVGMNVGDTKEITVTLTDDEHNGETAVYTVTLNSIKVYAIPDITDEMAQKYTKFNTYAEYETALRNSIETEYANSLAAYKLDLILDDVVANSTYNGFPEGAIDGLVQQAIDVVKEKSTELGISEDEYLTKYANIETMDQFKTSITKDAEDYMKIRMALSEIARVEKVDVTQSDIEEYKTMLRAYYSLDEGADTSQYESDDDVLFECIVEKIRPFLIDNNTFNVTESSAENDTSDSADTAASSEETATAESSSN